MQKTFDLFFTKTWCVVLALSCLLFVSHSAQGQVVSGGAMPAGAGEKETVRSLGVYVTITRLSQITDTGLIAIPQGALVSVTESAGGQKHAVFRQTRVPIADLSKVSNDPSLIAAATAGAAAKAGNLSPGTVMDPGAQAAPRARTQQQILVDESGKVISKSMTTTIDDGAGNMTTIRQGNASGMTPERAARLAAAQQRISQQKTAIQELKIRRLNKSVVSGYEAKLQGMTDLLTRMEVEYARMQAEYSQ
jgi:hypothetical protein